MSLEHSPARSRPQGGTSRRSGLIPTSTNSTIASSAVRKRHVLRLDREALARDAVNGKLGIPYHRFGQLSRYRRSELDTWAEAQRRRGIP